MELRKTRISWEILRILIFQAYHLATLLLARPPLWRLLPPNISFADVTMVLGLIANSTAGIGFILKYSILFTQNEIACGRSGDR